MHVENTACYASFRASPFRAAELGVSGWQQKNLICVLFISRERRDEELSWEQIRGPEKEELRDTVQTPLGCNLVYSSPSGTLEQPAQQRRGARSQERTCRLWTAVKR